MRLTDYPVISQLVERPKTSSASPVPFLHLLSRLKTTKREGWRRKGLPNAESISDHMYRMAIMTLIAPLSIQAGLDTMRCVKMALVHDMAEALVGDITPVDGVSRWEKSRRESETMDYICGGLLGGFDGGRAAEDVRALWQEYEDNESPEAKFVHDIDKLELLLSMVDYEKAGDGEHDLGEFCHVARRIHSPLVKEWCDEILKERFDFWTAPGPAKAQGLPVENLVRDAASVKPSGRKTNLDP
jgi:putative hydrolases of HD superfamily